ncbi:hypothetical protein QUF88_02115 [Bacillus sp. DX1.1]|uniref:hypothetical protein n=1 Tax=Bacillus sp. DX1.1 TaxID=3055866 RepID=UPI0025A1392A|nr:hypothetical protein [Bacillus sp. DX1.1]MDM5152771.1 hypothetical protein [Bacillus sp. DX1.1]
MERLQRKNTVRIRFAEWAILHVEVGPGKQMMNYGKEIQHTVDLQDLCILRSLEF